MLSYNLKRALYQPYCKMADLKNLKTARVRHIGKWHPS